MEWFLIGLAVWAIIALVNRARPKGAYAKLSRRDLAEHRRMAQELEAVTVEQLRVQAEAMRQARQPYRSDAHTYDPVAERRYGDLLSQAANRGRVSLEADQRAAADRARWTNLHGR